MRPTLLGFRSPKEQTPGPYYPTLTTDGNSLLSSPLRAPRFSFTTSPRFSQTTALRTFSQVGPGSYSPEQVKEAIVGTPICKRPAQSANDGYFYVGEHLVHEPRLRYGRRLSLAIASQGPARRPTLSVNTLYKKVRQSSSPLVKRVTRKRSPGRRRSLAGQLSSKLVKPSEFPA